MSHINRNPNWTPYDTGKVRIGCNYQPPRRPIDMGRDAELLQAALLGIDPSPEDRLMRVLTRYGTWVVLVLIFVALAFLAGFGSMS
jgi:hypothetical protein